jgi:hypothetical protein
MNILVGEGKNHDLSEMADNKNHLQEITQIFRPRYKPVFPTACYHLDRMEELNCPADHDGYAGKGSLAS